MSEHVAMKMVGMIADIVKMRIHPPIRNHVKAVFIVALLVILSLGRRGARIDRLLCPTQEQI